MAEAFPHCFDLLSPRFQLSSFSHFPLVIFFFFLLLCIVFFSLSLSFFASVCSFFNFFCLFSRTDLFKISKDRSGGLAARSLSAYSPSLFLTDKQKSETAGLAALYCLPSFLYPSLFSSCGGDWRLDCVCVCYLVWHQLSLLASRRPLCLKHRPPPIRAWRKLYYIRGHLALAF